MANQPGDEDNSPADSAEDQTPDRAQNVSGNPNLAGNAPTSVIQDRRAGLFGQTDNYTGAGTAPGIPTSHR